MISANDTGPATAGPRVTLDRDVAVVGAGPAGLMAARILRAGGASVAVLEARDRVGGRTWSDTIDGAFLEIGGQWVSPNQDELLTLLTELGLRTYPRYRDGDAVYLAPGGTRVRYSGSTLPASGKTVAEIDRLTTLLDGLAAAIGADEPWASPRARELDTVSFRHWLRQQSADEEACDAVGLFIAGGMLTRPAHSFSALQAVYMAASAGSFTHLTDADFILDRRIVGGMQLVSQAMAAALGDDVHLASPVRAIRRHAAGSTVVSDRVTVRAPHVIVAVPPPLYSRISFDPPLPRRQHQLHQHLAMGLVIKVHAVYKTPFWRSDGLSGTCFGVGSLVQEVYDNTNPAEERGTLVGFVSDEQADHLYTLSADERRRRILDSIGGFLGEQAREPVVYYESDWAAEEWTRGAYAASFDLGGLSRYGNDMRTPVDCIHWACADIAAAGFQHVDGALRMGRAAAQAVLAASISHLSSPP